MPVVAPVRTLAAWLAAQADATTGGRLVARVGLGALALRADTAPLTWRVQMAVLLAP